MRASSVRDIAAIVRGRRRHLGLSQASLAAKTGVGREWIIEFEKGKASVEWGYVVRVLRVLGLSIDLEPEGLPSEPASSDVETILESTLKGAGRP